MKNQNIKIKKKSMMWFKLKFIQDVYGKSHVGYCKTKKRNIFLNDPSISLNVFADGGIQEISLFDLILVVFARDEFFEQLIFSWIDGYFLHVAFCYLL